MSSQDAEYYRERARTERAQANDSEGNVAEIHLALAKQYETLVQKMESSSVRNIPTG